MRAPNMQTLTDDIKADNPGVVIYGKGDDDHAERISDHNEDDTPGVRTPQTDSDNIREHRAIDVMLGPNFTKTDANELVTDLVTNPDCQKRLSLVIFNGHEWSRSGGWVMKTYTGSDNHSGHVHVSGRASDDANTAHWPVLKTPSTPPPTNNLVVDGKLGPKTIKRWQEIMHTEADGIISEPSELVKAVQRHLNKTIDADLKVDGLGIHQDGESSRTIGALQSYLKIRTDRFMSVPESNVVKALQRRLNTGKF